MMSVKLIDIKVKIYPLRVPELLRPQLPDETAVLEVPRLLPVQHLLAGVGAVHLRVLLFPLELPMNTV